MCICICALCKYHICALNIAQHNVGAEGREERFNYNPNSDANDGCAIHQKEAAASHIMALQFLLSAPTSNLWPSRPGFRINFSVLLNEIKDQRSKYSRNQISAASPLCMIIKSVLRACDAKQLEAF